jgi:hypothetical protein
LNRTPRTPRHLLRDLVSFRKATVTTESASASPEWVNTTTAVEVMGRLQPLSASDAMIYGRETTTVLYNLFFDPYDNNGTLVPYTNDEWKTVVATINGTTYRVDGAARDADTAGCLFQVTLERI